MGFTYIIWASTWENLSLGVCEQHRSRPACASAQSDQRLFYWLFGKYHMFTCYRWNFNILASLCSWGDRFETRFVGNPEDSFCRDEAHDKTNNMAVCHENTLISLGISSVLVIYMKKAWIHIVTHCVLSKCPGWSESLLRTQFVGFVPSYLIHGKSMQGLVQRTWIRPL